jgi:hypothetical protein
MPLALRLSEGLGRSACHSRETKLNFSCRSAEARGYDWHGPTILIEESIYLLSRHRRLASLLAEANPSKEK